MLFLHFLSEAMCAEISSSLGILRFFLEIRDLPTTKPMFVTDAVAVW